MFVAIVVVVFAIAVAAGIAVAVASAAPGTSFVIRPLNVLFGHFLVFAISSGALCRTAEYGLGVMQRVSNKKPVHLDTVNIEIEQMNLRLRFPIHAGYPYALNNISVKNNGFSTGNQPLRKLGYISPLWKIPVAQESLRLKGCLA